MIQPDDPDAPVDASTHLDEMIDIARRAVRKARARSLELGVPNVYEHNGRLYWESPDGEFTTYDPWTGPPDEPAQAETPDESP